jgi:PAS domain S-box-containing protein
MTRTLAAALRRLAILSVGAMPAVAILAAFSVCIFLADLALPAGRALVVLYVIVVILSGRQARVRWVVITAMLCITLTTSGYLIRHGVGWHPDYMARRAFSVLAIGVSAILTMRNQLLQQQRIEKAALLDLTYDAMFARDDHDVITFWSRRAEALYGWSAQEALGRRSSDLIALDEPGHAAIAHARLLQDGRWDGVTRHRLRDGRDIAVMSHWALQTDRRGRMRAILETNTDITERISAETEIRASEERYRRIFDMTGAAIWEEDYSKVMPLIEALRASGVTDFDQYYREHPEAALEALARVRVVDVNRTAVTFFRASSKQELMMSLERLFLTDTLASFGVLLAALAAGRSSCEAETTVQTLRGERKSILMAVTFPPKEEPLTSVLVSIMDNTERNAAKERLRMLEEELARATRVATLGELTSFIAHDVDEPIAAIIAHGRDSLARLHRSEPDLAATTRAIGGIIREGRRAAEIVSRIRSFLRRDLPRHALFDLRATLEAATLLVQREILHHRISFRLDVESDLPPIAGDRARIEHVVVHLMVNAIQSMVGTTGRAGDLRVAAYRQDNEVIIAFRDNRDVYEAANTERLFGPVFTTHGDHTGLDTGLAICRATIEAHGGRIWATRANGIGALVRLALPIEAAATP